MNPHQKSSINKKSKHTLPPPRLLPLIYTKKWDQCIEATKLYPNQAELSDRMGDYPLHEACNSGAPFSLVQALYRSYPNAISQPGFCGRLPLHYASYSKPSLHVIQFLLNQYPDGASKFDNDGRLPLHLAIVRNAPKQAIQALIEAYPKSIFIPNNFGMTPEMLARNEHVYNLLIEEKAKPRHINQKLDIEKKLMKNWRFDEKGKTPIESNDNKDKDSNDTTSRVSKTKALIESRSPSYERDLIRAMFLASEQSFGTIQATNDDMDHMEKSTESKQYKSSKLDSPRSPRSLYGYDNKIMITKNRRKVLPSPERD